MNNRILQRETYKQSLFLFFALTKIKGLYTKCGGHAYHLKASDNSQKMIKK